jgi:hypothetical protein
MLANNLANADGERVGHIFIMQTREAAVKPTNSPPLPDFNPFYFFHLLWLKFNGFVSSRADFHDSDLILECHSCVCSILLWRFHLRSLLLDR